MKIFLVNFMIIFVFSLSNDIAHCIDELPLHLLNKGTRASKIEIVNNNNKLVYRIHDPQLENNGAFYFPMIETKYWGSYEWARHGEILCNKFGFTSLEGSLGTIHYSDNTSFRYVISVNINGFSEIIELKKEDYGRIKDSYYLPGNPINLLPCSGDRLIFEKYYEQMNQVIELQNILFEAEEEDKDKAVHTFLRPYIYYNKRKLYLKSKYFAVEEKKEILLNKICQKLYFNHYFDHVLSFLEKPSYFAVLDEKGQLVSTTKSIFSKRYFDNDYLERISCWDPINPQGDGSSSSSSLLPELLPILKESTPDVSNETEKKGQTKDDF